MFDVVVIGGGPAGIVAALRAHELGMAVALIERGPLGGMCVNDGCVPTRVLAKAARLMRDSAQLREYGMKGTIPELDFSGLLSKTRQIVENVHQKKQLTQNLRRAGVQMWTEVGEARFADEHTVTLTDGTRVSGEKFIICAGGHSRRLPFPGHERVLTLADVWSLERLPSSAAVIGASATGCQLASVLAAFGTRVSLLDVAERVLPAADACVSQALSDAFRDRGIDVITGISGVEGVDACAGGLELRYGQEGTSRSVVGEEVIMAVGWPGNVGALNLSAAGVRTLPSGYIEVDDRLQTSMPHIFAAGDITGRAMLVQSADHQGRIAAENAVLGMDRSFSSTVLPYGGFTDPEYAGVGLTEAQARAQHDCVVSMVTYADLDRAVIDGRTVGCFKLIVSRKTRRILGAHVVGEQALEVTQIVAAGMAAGMRLEQLAALKIAYPTFAAIVGVAARRLVRELGVIPLAPHWRDLIAPQVADWERSHRPLLETDLETHSEADLPTPSEARAEPASQKGTNPASP